MLYILHVHVPFDIALEEFYFHPHVVKFIRLILDIDCLLWKIKIRLKPGLKYVVVWKKIFAHIFGDSLAIKRQE